MTRRQASAFRDALLRGGFRLAVHHRSAFGITSTRLDLPGVVSVVLTTDEQDTKNIDAYFHWRRTPRARSTR